MEIKHPEPEMEFETMLGQRCKVFLRGRRIVFVFDDENAASTYIAEMKKATNEEPEGYA